MQAIAVTIDNSIATHIRQLEKEGKNRGAISREGTVRSEARAGRVAKRFVFAQCMYMAE